MKDQHTVVLMSGGIDSSATLARCRDTTDSNTGLFVDYAQPAAKSEFEAAQLIAAHYEIQISEVNLGFGLYQRRGEFFGRNALFVLVAAAVEAERPLQVAIGIHALAEYYDTTPVFARQMKASSMDTLAEPLRCVPRLSQTRNLKSSVLLETQVYLYISRIVASGKTHLLADCVLLVVTGGT